MDTVYTNQTCSAIIGFTRGRINGVPSVDPGSRDLSDPGLVPFSTGVEGTPNVLLTATSAPVLGTVTQTGRMFEGQTLTYTVNNVPAGLLLAFLNFDVGSVNAYPIPLGLAPAGCTTNFPNFLPILFNFTSVVTLAGGNFAFPLPLGPVPAHNAPGSWASLGLVVTAQAWGVDTGTFLVPWTSNTLKYTVGLD